MTLDRNSNLQALLDPRQNSASATFDPVDRMISQTHRLGGITRYQYDTLDRITKVTAPNGVITSYTYDLLGRKLTETSPDRGTIQYSYDLANNITQITDGRGIPAIYDYDELERITSKTLPTTTEHVIYEYDDCPFGKGRLCSVSDESGQTTYRYDAFGNLVEKQHTELNQTYITAYSYDAGDHLIAMTLPSGRLVNYTRDGVRRIESISAVVNGSQTLLVSGIRYRADNQMTQCSFGNGLTDQRSYDQQGRLIDQNLTTAIDTSVDLRHYDYDANGNIINREATPQDSQYQYDALNRLINDAIAGQATIDYGYDLNDNREHKDTENLSVDYQYQATSNRLTVSETNRIGDEPLSVQVTRQLEYNDVGRLYQLFENGELIATYTYNAYGQRTRKVTADSTTVYHYDSSGQLISETRADGTPVRDYIRGDGELVAQIDVAGTERLSYLHIDHLSTPRLATDSNGTVVWRWEGEGFGSAKPEENPDGNGLRTVVNMRFPGQYFDFESGLYYNYYRYYDPLTGRYITSDPIGLDGGLNTYGYVDGNPIANIDQNGLRRANPWNRFQQRVAGRGLSMAQKRSLYRQLQLSNLARNPNLHDALENLPDRAVEDALQGLKCDSSGKCKIERLKCECNNGNGAGVCTGLPEMKSFPEDNASCTCWPVTEELYL
jgi:RHS repeat-associated protein